MNDMDMSPGPGRTILSEQWLGILDLLKSSAFTIDLNRKITSCNQSAQSLLGISEDEILGKECWQVFKGVPCATCCPYREGNSEPKEIEVELLDAENRPHLVTRLTAPIYNVNQELQGYLILIQDRMSLAEILNRIRYGEKSLKIILDNLDLALFTVNRGGYITFFNDAAESITGYSRQEVLGKPCLEILGPAGDHVQKPLQACLKYGRSKSTGPTKILTAQGTITDVKIDLMPLSNEQEKLVGGLVTLHDLTLARKLDEVITEEDSYQGMIGRDPKMQQVFEVVEQIGPSEATVLIEGATGTGKDHLARAIHLASERKQKPLVKVNCAAIPYDLLESEMFGYTKGAFTGAVQDKPGRFQEADGGSIFLDEIGDLPLSLQGKLLRVLEDREFYPLGGRHVVRVDVRILAATNSNLEELMSRGQFREDLFYRLNVCRLELPALQERKADLPLLIWHILRRLAAAQKVRTPEISAEAMEVLLNYQYPGNVRELENILEYALLTSRGKTIESRHIQPYVYAKVSRSQRCPRDERDPTTQSQEKQRILEALQRHNWHKKQTAQELGMDRSTLWRKMKRHGLNS
ncbi:MAG: sigma 54-interacting transcriptional regulator [Desulfohalobiaceae bacterium]